MEREAVMNEPFGEVISSYSRAQAIEDGVLVDVSDMAREAGFKFPVAMTRTVWGQYVEVPHGVQAQDEAGRLWDVLWMLLIAIKTGKGGSVIEFSLLVRNHNHKLHHIKDRVSIKAICCRGDDTEPVITIMLPNED